MSCYLQPIDIPIHFDFKFHHQLMVCIECYAVPFLLFVLSFISTPLMRLLLKVPVLDQTIRKWAPHLIPADSKNDHGTKSNIQAEANSTSCSPSNENQEVSTVAPTAPKSRKTAKAE
jgi:hypothetical protein